MVDDDEDDHVLARNAFEASKAPGTFYCVEDAIELFEYLFHSGKYGTKPELPHPALILLDLNMPRKNGNEILKEVKSIRALKDIPIVIFTTSRDEDEMAYSLEVGAEAYITKPSSFRGWVEVMKSLCCKGLHDSLKSPSTILGTERERLTRERSPFENPAHRK